MSATFGASGQRSSVAQPANRPSSTRAAETSPDLFPARRGKVPAFASAPRQSPEPFGHGAHDRLQFVVSFVAQRPAQPVQVRFAEPKDAFQYLPPRVIALGQAFRDFRQSGQGCPPLREETGPGRVDTRKHLDIHGVQAVQNVPGTGKECQFRSRSVRRVGQPCRFGLAVEPRCTTTGMIGGRDREPGGGHSWHEGRAACRTAPVETPRLQVSEGSELTARLAVQVRPTAGSVRMVANRHVNGDIRTGFAIDAGTGLGRPLPRTGIVRANGSERIPDAEVVKLDGGTMLHLAAPTGKRM